MDKKPNQAMARRQSLEEIDKQLATEADTIKSTIGRPTGRKITVKNRQFILPDGTILGDNFDAIIIEYISVNRFYVGQYSPSTPQPPACYAMNKNIDLMAPPDDVPEKQAEACKVCPQNAWGSDPRGGNGKACKNCRDIVLVLPANAADEDPPLYFMSVSPTGIKNFDACVARVLRDAGGPIIKAVTNISLADTEYAQLVFDPVGLNEYLPELVPHRERALEILFTPPDTSSFQKVPATPARQAPGATRRR